MSMKGEAAKSIAIYNIFDNNKQIKDLDKEELQFEVDQWRRLWDYIPIELQGLLAQIGQEVFVFKRDGDSFQGHFSGFECSVSYYKFKTTERLRSNVDKKFFIYESETTVPKSNVVDFKFIKGTFEDTPEPEY